MPGRALRQVEVLAVDERLGVFPTRVGVKRKPWTTKDTKERERHERFFSRFSCLFVAFVVQSLSWSSVLRDPAFSFAGGRGAAYLPSLGCVAQPKDRSGTAPADFAVALAFPSVTVR